MEHPIPPIRLASKSWSLTADLIGPNASAWAFFQPDSFVFASVSDPTSWMPEEAQGNPTHANGYSLGDASLFSTWSAEDAVDIAGTKANVDPAISPTDGSHSIGRDGDSAFDIGDDASITELHARVTPGNHVFIDMSLAFPPPSSSNTLQEPPNDWARNGSFAPEPSTTSEPAHALVGHAPRLSVGEVSEPVVPISAAPEATDGPAEVLVNGDGEIVSVLSNSAAGGGGASSGGTSSGTASSAGGATASPFVINIIYDASVNNAPAAFKTAVAAVVQYFESQYTDHVTINIAVGYGEVGGYTLGAGALGESLTYLNSYSYSQIKNALSADAKTADDMSAIATLPASSPVNGTFWESRAEAKATGLIGASSSIDGYVGFAAGNLFDYDNSNGVSGGQYDFFGVVSHEITEVMGRALLVGGTIGGTPNGYYPLDFFHYSANGVRDFSGTTPGYFSINGGATNLDNFNTNPGGDYGDWASSAGNDAFLAFSPSGVVDIVSQTDLRELDVLGWDRTSSSTTPPPPPAQADLAVTGFAFTGAHFSYHVSNIGAGSATASTAGIFVSTSATGPQSLIGTIGTGALAAGASDNEAGTLSWSSNPSPGIYYISVAADYKNVVAESNESNNQSSKIAIVLGNGSSNTLTGTAGNDVIIGLGGKDTLTGGAGADQFLFNTAINKSTPIATITDFSHATGDKIDLDHIIFTALTQSALGGPLAAGDFYASSNGAAHLATDHVLYNTTTGALSYDPDGTGAAAAMQIATIAQHPTLTSGDLLLV